jgi:hypothetical protein
VDPVHHRPAEIRPAFCEQIHSIDHGFSLCVVHHSMN